jgi:hypothetical protein
MEKLGKIVSAIGVGVLLVGASAALTHKIDSNSTQSKIDALTADFKSQLDAKPKEVVKTVEVSVPVEKIVNVTVEDPQTVADLNAAMDFIHNNVNDAISVNYIVFETDAQIEAESYIRDNFKSLLDDNKYFDDGAIFGEYRKSEVSVKKIYDPTFSSQDYDKNSADLTFKVKVHAEVDKDTKTDQYFDIVVPFDKGVIQSEDITVDLV